MKFLLSFLLSCGLAGSTMALGSSNGLTTESTVGKNLMSKARRLNDNNNNYYTWVAKYSIKFDGCVSIPGFERDEGMRTSMLAKFKLCPSDKCSRCPNAGEYVVEMREFIEAYQESKREAQAYECELAQENCEYQCENGLYEYEMDYNYGGDNYCEYICMSDANMAFCNDESGDNGFNMEELSECRALGEDNNNNNNNNNQYNYGDDSSSYQQYYVGSYCTSSGVYVGTFTDPMCTQHAKKGTYYEQTGYYLPTDPLVDYSCVSCKEVQYDNNDNGDNNNNNNGDNANYNYGNDYYDQDTVLETCEKLYEQSGKCESNLKDSNILYKDTSGCETIHKTLPRLSRAFSGNGFRTSVFLAWFFGVGCLILGAYIFVIFNKQTIRQRIGVNRAAFLDDVPEVTRSNGVAA